MAIDYHFKNPALLEEALTHPSLSRDNSANYQRLEFLGDTILAMIMAELLLKKHQTENEGELSKRQAHLVSGEVISQIAKRIGIGEIIKISFSEESAGGRNNKRNLENAMEALIAAIYLDSNLEICRQFVIKHWQDFIDQNVLPPKDPITSLQEIMQAKTKMLPIYRTNKTSGHQHRPIFTSIVEIDDKEFSAEGCSKKEAQKNAAIKALATIKS